jgi:hypothetical protein
MFTSVLAEPISLPPVPFTTTLTEYRPTGTLRNSTVVDVGALPPSSWISLLE